MAAPLFASTDDLAARVGLIPSSEQARATACIQDASALVLAEVGTAGAAWTADNVPPDVFTVVLAVAGRVYRNPEGLVSQTVGPITEVRAAASVSAYLTDYERGLVRRAAGKTALSTVHTTRGEDSFPTGRYLYAVGSDEPVPWFPDRWGQ